MKGLWANIYNLGDVGLWCGLNNLWMLDDWLSFSFFLMNEHIYSIVNDGNGWEVTFPSLKGKKIHHLLRRDISTSITFSIHHHHPSPIKRGSTIQHDQKLSSPVPFPSKWSQLFSMTKKLGKLQKRIDRVSLLSTWSQSSMSWCHIPGWGNYKHAGTMQLNHVDRLAGRLDTQRGKVKDCY